MHPNAREERRDRKTNAAAEVAEVIYRLGTVPHAKAIVAANDLFASPGLVPGSMLLSRPSV